MIHGAGVDVGSTQTKAVIVDEGRRIVARALIATGANVSRAGENAFLEACRAAGLARETVGYVVGTGYGRYKVTFGDAQITEITCHARGASYLFPATRTVIDMGGQDAKAIKMGADGDVIDFSMNDKCAAGTGASCPPRPTSPASGSTRSGRWRSRRRPPSASPRSARCSWSPTSCRTWPSARPSRISSAASTGRSRPGPCRWSAGSASRRITFTGGVSRNTGMVRALEEVLGKPINVSDEGHYIGALGAALFALERAQARARGETVASGAARS